jgi:Spy/CpxP family protein refolding chaperone
MTDRKTLIALFAVAAFALGSMIAVAQSAPAQQTPAAPAATAPAAPAAAPIERQPPSGPGMGKGMGPGMKHPGMGQGMRPGMMQGKDAGNFRGDGRMPRRGKMEGGFRGEHGGGMEAGFRIVPEGMWWKNPMVVQRLALRPEQTKKMEGIFEQSRLQLIDLKANVEKQNALLEPLLSANPPDTIKAMAQIDKVAQARAELEKTNARMLLGIRVVLTPDQWTKLHAGCRRIRRI